MNDDNTLIYKIEKIEGVEIDVLCNSLQAMKNEYLRFTNNKKKLIVKEIRKGSGIFEFTDAFIVSTLLFMEYSNTILQFAEYLATVKDVLLKKSDRLKLTPTTVNNMNSMLSPVVNGSNNVINIFVGNHPGLLVEQDDYKEIEKQSKQILEEITSSNSFLIEDCIYKKVLFKWVQTRFDDKKTGNQGIIKQIQEKALKVIFADDNSVTKTEMTTTIQGIDWQKIKYIVDVETMTDNNRIVAYKILKNYPEDCIIEESSNLELF